MIPPTFAVHFKKNLASAPLISGVVEPRFQSQNVDSSGILAVLWIEAEECFS